MIECLEGSSPNSRKNLEKNRFTTETARKASEKAVEAKRKYKDVQDCFRTGTSDDDREKMLSVLKELAFIKKDLKAMELYVKYLGEEPAQKIEQTNIDVKVEFEDGID